jgi:hypothetical protein
MNPHHRITTSVAYSASQMDPRYSRTPWLRRFGAELRKESVPRVGNPGFWKHPMSRENLAESTKAAAD